MVGLQPLPQLHQRIHLRVGTRDIAWGVLGDVGGALLETVGGGVHDKTGARVMLPGVGLTTTAVTTTLSAGNTLKQFKR
jgi:hypothetical protein